MFGHVERSVFGRVERSAVGRLERSVFGCVGCVWLCGKQGLFQASSLSSLHSFICLADDSYKSAPETTDYCQKPQPAGGGMEAGAGNAARERRSGTLGNVAPARVHPTSSLPTTSLR